MTVRAFALLGSGEFDPWTESVDRRLVGRADAPGSRVLILPTAAAAEGDDVFDMWANKGRDHYDALGIESQIVPLKTRADAADPAFVSALEGAALAFFSGGNPAYLAATLRDTPFWEALRGGIERGLAYGGCSAGIACLGDSAPDSARRTFDDSSWEPGLRLFPGFQFGPHWDALDGFAPGLTDFIVAAVPEGSTLVAVDENTAIVGDGGTWDVEGVGGVHILSHGDWMHHAPGDRFPLPMLP